MKKLFIVHRWEGSPTSDWYQWLAREVSGSFDVNILEMPNPNEPVIEEWVSFINKNVKNLSENVYLIGHSIGCQAILRFLEHSSFKVGKVFFVAPWLTLTPAATDGVERIASPWLETPINWESIKCKASEFTCLFSDNDPYVAYENRKVFKQNLSAQIISVGNKGHITEEDDITELSELADLIKIS